MSPQVLEAIKRNRRSKWLGSSGPGHRREPQVVRPVCPMSFQCLAPALLPKCHPLTQEQGKECAGWGERRRGWPPPRTGTGCVTLGGLRFFSWLQRLPPQVAVATSELGPLLSRPCRLASHSEHSLGRRTPCVGPSSAVQGVWWLFPGPQCAPLRGGGRQLAGSWPRASVCMCVCTCVFPHVCPYLTCKNAPYPAPTHTSNTSPQPPSQQ